MNLLTIAAKSIRQRALSSSLTALSVALGVALMVTVLVLHGIFGQIFSQNSTGYDLIVGPKGSKLQLVLNTVYRVSQPIENLPYRYYRELRDDPRIEDALPMALGDTTQVGDFPTVGTVPKFFTVPYAVGRKFAIRGELMADDWDAIIGSAVARRNGWDVGTEFQMIHGGQDEHVHDEKFTVVGVLAPTGTPNDKTVFVHLNGFYLLDGHDKPLREGLKRVADFYGEEMPDEATIARMEKEHAHDHGAEGEAGHSHAHHDHGVHEAQKEVTAVLVNMAVPPGTPEKERDGERLTAIYFFQSELQKGYKAQGVNPSKEIRWLMENIVGNVRIVLMVLTVLIIVVSGVGIFVSIYNSMADRKKEIAIMRALGARRRTVFAIILAESTLLCLAGGVLGVLLGHGGIFAASPIVEARSDFLIDPFAFEPAELVLIPGLIVLASLIGFVPGMTAYRTDVAKTLAD